MNNHELIEELENQNKKFKSLTDEQHKARVDALEKDCTENKEYYKESYPTDPHLAEPSIEPPGGFYQARTDLLEKDILSGY